MSHVQTQIVLEWRESSWETWCTFSLLRGANIYNSADTESSLRRYGRQLEASLMLFSELKIHARTHKKRSGKDTGRKTHAFASDGSGYRFASTLFRRFMSLRANRKQVGGALGFFWSEKKMKSGFLRRHFLTGKKLTKSSTIQPTSVLFSLGFFFLLASTIIWLAMLANKVFDGFDSNVTPRLPVILQFVFVLEFLFFFDIIVPRCTSFFNQ